jgi:hypothetical protein
MNRRVAAASVVPGYRACRKRFKTSHQFVDHLANDVLPAAIAKLDEKH